MDFGKSSPFKRLWTMCGDSWNQVSVVDLSGKEEEEEENDNNRNTNIIQPKNSRQGDTDQAAGCLQFAGGRGDRARLG